MDGADIDMVEVVPGAVYASANMPPEVMDVLRQVAADVITGRARAPEEARKAEAPCHACGKTMPAAERCAACVEAGVWYCARCHAEFEGDMADGRLVNSLATTMLN